MSEEFDFSTGMPSEEMAEYLQMYLDETSEQLDGLVECLLVLENHPTDAEQLQEAFRLIHSIKGSSAMIGLDGVTVLTHHLENHFERLRSGLRELDQAAMGLILRCIDFLRECNRRLRAGEALASAPELLEELAALSVAPAAATPRTASESPRVAAPPPAVAAPVAPASAAQTVSPFPPAILVPPPIAVAAQAAPVVRTSEAPRAQAATSVAARDYRLVIGFEAELSLTELKAELVLARLAEFAQVRETLPPRAELESASELRSFQVFLSTTATPAELRGAADVDGVEWIEVETDATTFATSKHVSAQPVLPVAAPPKDLVGIEEEVACEAAAEPVCEAALERVIEAHASETTGPRAKVVETVRVDIERLDNLMNLAGELVVNKARFVQIARQMSPAFKKSGLPGRARAFSESMRRALQWMKSRVAGDTNGTAEGWPEQLHELESEIDAIEEQAKLWEQSRRGFTQITEAIDQMTRVSDSLQRGVLDTRMVPVAPLFNRFKRVVRDIAIDLGKQVVLEIHGEKTELDKRMIDELGDPLVHLVRNAIDHGIETAELRARRGKPEVGTIRLEAAHSGNNVLISVRDDGEGIHVEKVRRRIVERGLAPASVAEGLSDRDVIEYIWHPGFSTAEVVTDISGRGVGMDIVKTRISELNGTIDINHAPGRGTTFTIRLPLTLAIIRSLLFRLRHGIFAVPIDNVREIVSVPVEQIITIRGKQTIDVRGEFIPLVDIDDLFDWHNVPYRESNGRESSGDDNVRRVNVVILHSGDKTMGLKVDELQGGQDIVIKSLAENFINIRGLSGASILGDGSVCLLFDVRAAIAMAIDPHVKATAS